MISFKTVVYLVYEHGTNKTDILGRKRTQEEVFRHTTRLARRYYDIVSFFS